MPLPLLGLLALGAGGVAAGGAALGAARRQGKPRNPLEDDPDALEIDRGEDSAFLAFLDTLGAPGRVVNNTLMGNFEGAGRNLVDFGGDLVDASLPGDWIPHISRKMDKPGFSDVAGGMEPGIGKFAVDVIGGAATDPLTFIPGAAIGKGVKSAGQLAEKAALQLPRGERLVKGVKDTAATIGKKVEPIGRKVRATFGAQRLTDPTRKTLEQSQATRTKVATAGRAETERIFKGLNEAEQEAVGDIIDDYLWQDGKLVGSLSAKAERGLSVPGVSRPAPTKVSTLERVALHPSVTPENQERIAAAVKAIVGDGKKMGFSKVQANEGIQRGIFKESPEKGLKPGVTEFVQGGERVMRQGLDDAFTEVSPGLGNFREDYLMRMFKGQTDDELAEAAMGRPSAVKGLKLKTLEDTQRFLSDPSNTGVAYERNALKRLGTRADQQGMLAQRAEIGRAVFGKEFAYADDEMRKLASESIKALPPEDAQVLLDAFQGLGARKKPMEWLAKANRYFKPAAVYGAFLPKVGSIVRNRLSGVWQGLSSPASRGAILDKGVIGNLKSVSTDIADAFTQVFKPNALKTGELTDALAAMDNAFATSGGLADNATATLRQAGRSDLADAIDAGALDGFVSSEELIKEMSTKPWKKNFGNIMNWPGKVFKGVEDRMRLGMFLDLRKSGKSAQEAGSITRDTFYSYAISSAENRAARDLIPFFQFPAKAIVQQGKLLKDQPWVAGALSRGLVGGDDEDVYPYMEGRLNIPLGEDEEGNSQYAKGFGLPFEALNMIPGSFRDVERNVVGSMAPPIKSLYGAVSGEDPFFESPYGSYGKVPIAGEAGAAGRAYNVLAGSGAIQPLDSPLRLIDKAMDDSKSPFMKALDLLTGANVVSVDPDLALQQQLTQELKANPQIKQYRGFYSDGGDDATDALLKKYQAAKARLKAKRAADKP